MKGSRKLVNLTITILGLLLIFPSISFRAKPSKSLPSLTSTKKWKVRGGCTIMNNPNIINTRLGLSLWSGETYARHLNVTVDGQVVPEQSPGIYLLNISRYNLISGNKIVVEITSPKSSRILSQKKHTKKPKVTAVATLRNIAELTQPVNGGTYTLSRLERDIIINWTRGKAPYTLIILEGKKGEKELYVKRGIMSNTHSVPVEIFAKKGIFGIYLGYKMNGFSLSGEYTLDSKIKLTYFTKILFTVK